MSGIDRVKEKMKKKLTLGALPVTPPPVEKEETNARKIYSLTQSDNQKLKKIFSKRLSLEGGSSISTLMSEAVSLLYSQEFPS